MLRALHSHSKECVSCLFCKLHVVVIETKGCVQCLLWLFCHQDADTALLRAVRSRNEECVRLLLDKGAKVSASDKVWHIPVS